MIKHYYKEIKDKKIQNIKKYRKGCWISVVDPTDLELKELAEKYKLELGHLNDAIDIYEIPRYEAEKNANYIYSRFLANQNETAETLPILIVYHTDFIMTISKSEPTFFTKLIKNNLSTTQKSKFLLQILSEMNYAYKINLHKISKQVNTISKNIETISNNEISKLVVYERFLNNYLSTFIPSNIIFHKLIDSKKIKFFDEDIDLVEDLSLSNNELIERSKSEIKYISNLREANTTVISNKLNKTMKLLTSVTVLLTIPTIIVGFFGMNVALPFQTNEHASGIIILITFVLLLPIGFLVFKEN